MKNVCFTGHRDIENSNELFDVLKAVLTELIGHGVTDFYAGGAQGFDTIAASVVVVLRRDYPIKLHLVLPYRRAEKTLSDEYIKLRNASDSVEYISEGYYNGCMRERNARLVQLADCCVCCYDTRKAASGTGQTVRMAERKGISVINLMK